MDATTQMKAHFNACYPEEGAGYIKDGLFYPLQNISSGDKREEVAVDPSFLLKEPQMFVHSHTTGWKQFDRWHDPRSPSYFDLKGQIDTGIEWGVMTTDGENCSDLYTWGNWNNRPPYEGRDFIHNIQDCLSLGQDWFAREYGIHLPNVARHPFWHDEGQDLMNDLYQEWGFYDIDISEARRGDWFLYAIRTPILRHIGIYLGNNQVLSHWYGRLSAVEPMGTWAKHIRKVIRHKDIV